MFAQYLLLSRCLNTCWCLRYTPVATLIPDKPGQRDARLARYAEVSEGSRTGKYFFEMKPAMLPPRVVLGVPKSSG